MQALRAHDLLWLSALPAPVAEWARLDWPVVVRRAQTPAGQVPVGLRGSVRSERQAGVIASASVLRVCTPEQLSNIDLPASLAPCAALDALRAASGPLNALGLAWGPTGSTGFALATGAPLLRADSDLDLVLRSAQPFTAQQRDALQAMLAEAGQRCRIDLQIDTGHGGFAFAEWAAGRTRVLLKTAQGPVLAANPWQMP